MKTEFILTQFYQQDCIAISFKEPDQAAFVTPLLFIQEKPDLSQQELADFMSSQLDEAVFKDMLALIATAAENYGKQSKKQTQDKKL